MSLTILGDFAGSIDKRAESREPKNHSHRNNRSSLLHLPLHSIHLSVCDEMYLSYRFLLCPNLNV